MNRRNFLQGGATLGLAGAMMLPRRSCAFPAAAKPSARLQHQRLSVGGSAQSLAYRWVDTMLDIAAQDILRYGARPTILARAMAIVTQAFFEAWAPFDATARSPLFGNSLRRPEDERTLANKQAAISYAAACALSDLYPGSRTAVDAALARLGYDPAKAMASRTDAIGSALMLGIRLTQNFRCPLARGSVMAFWQNWHITVSNWFRDYLFVPLA